MGSITKVAAAMGVAFSLGAIKDFIGGVFAAADAVNNLSLQWGISTKAVQQWSAAAAASGVETETLGKSIQFFTENLSANTEDYQALLANVGLSAEKLKGMKIEDAYKEVAKAITDVKDETLQLDIAQGLLGPAAKKLIGAYRDGMFEAADAQKFMTDETIKRLAAANNEWAKFYNNLVIYSGEYLAATMSMHERATRSWTTFFLYVSAAAGGGAGAVEDLDKKLRDQDKTLKGVVTTTETYAVAGQHLESGLKTTAQVLADNKKKEEALKAAQDARAAAQAELKKKQDAYNKSLADHKKAVDDLVDAFAGNDLVVKANLYLEALKASIPVQQMTRAEQDAINKVMKDAIGTYDAAGTDAPQAMYDIWAATLKADEATAQYEEDVSHFADTFTKKLGNLDLKGFKLTPAPGRFDDMAKGLTSALSSSILKAIEGGGNLFQAAGSTVGNFLLDPKQSGIGKAIETNVSKLPGVLGSAISGAIPVVGSLIGPAISWLGGKIAGLFGQKEYNKLRDSFVAAAGGMAPLIEAATAAGLSLDNLTKARNTDQVKAAITEIQAALDFQKTAYDAALEAAQRYGFTVEELGPAMARQELDKQAQQLFKDWEVLNSAGIDTVAITERMSTSVSEYVQHAMKMGTEVPEAMRPMLEAMVKSGTLLDENGNAITDLEDAGISFSLSMSDGFKALIEQVGKLTDAITRSLGTAITNIPPIEVPVTTPPAYNYRAPKTLPEYAEGTDGFRNFGTGTPVMLHGWEAVVPRSDSSGAFATVSAPVASTTAAALAPSIVINAQGAFFDTPGDLQRLADRVNDALTAKFGMQNTMRAG
jgi:hypothetical protein